MIIKLKRASKETWETKNFILASGEIGVEKPETGVASKFKIGNGITNWNDLPYAGLNAEDLDITYTTKMPIPINVGMIEAGQEFTNTPIKNVLDALFFGIAKLGVTLTSEDPITGNLGYDTLNVNVTATAENGVLPYTYTFTRSDTNEEIVTTDSLELVMTHLFENISTDTILGITITDGEGTVVSDTISVQFTELDLVTTFETGDKLQGEYGETLVIETIGEIEGGVPPFNVRFFNGVDQVQEKLATTDKKFSQLYNIVEATNLRFEVTDSRAVPVAEVQTIPVTFEGAANLVTTFASNAPIPTGDYGEELTIATTGRISSGIPPYTIRFLNGNTELQRYTNELRTTFLHTFTVTEATNLRFEVTDSYENPRTETKELTVNYNEATEVDALLTSADLDGTVGVAKNITVIATARFGYPDYTFAFYNNNVLVDTITQTSPECSYTFNNISANTTFRVNISDSVGDDVDSASVTTRFVQASAIAATFSTTSATTAPYGETLDIATTLNITGGGVPPYSVQYNGGEVIPLVGTTHNYNFTDVTETLSAVITDSIGTSPTTITIPVTIQPAIDIGLNLDIEDRTGTIGIAKDITVIATATELYPPYEFTFYMDGEALPAPTYSNVSSNVQSHTYVGIKDNSTFRVRVTDSVGNDFATSTIKPDFDSAPELRVDFGTNNLELGWGETLADYTRDIAVSGGYGDYVVEFTKDDVPIAAENIIITDNTYRVNFGNISGTKTTLKASVIDERGPDFSYDQSIDIIEKAADLFTLELVNNSGNGTIGLAHDVNTTLTIKGGYPPFTLKFSDGSLDVEINDQSYSHDFIGLESDDNSRSITVTDRAGTTRTATIEVPFEVAMDDVYVTVYDYTPVAGRGDETNNGIPVYPDLNQYIKKPLEFKSPIVHTDSTVGTHRRFVWLYPVSWGIPSYLITDFGNEYFNDSGILSTNPTDSVNFVLLNQVDGRDILIDNIPYYMLYKRKVDNIGNDPMTYNINF